MKNLVLYVHGKGGSAAESEHYKSLFPGCEVTGLDYQSSTPWETGEEIRQAVEKLKNEYERIIMCYRYCDNKRRHSCTTDWQQRAGGICARIRTGSTRDTETKTGK